MTTGAKKPQAYYQAKYADILAGLAAGMSLNEVGRKHGITGQRVLTIERSAGLSFGNVTKGKWDAVVQELIALRNSGQTFAQIGHKYGMNPGIAHRLISRSLNKRELPVDCGWVAYEKLIYDDVAYAQKRDKIAAIISVSLDREKEWPAAILIADAIMKELAL